MTTTEPRPARTVIDADSHFMEPFDWLESTFPKLHEQLPTVPPRQYFVETYLEGKVGDLDSSLPVEMRPTFEEIFGTGIDPDTIDLREISAFGSLENYDGAARSAWAQERGIDVQFMVPTLGIKPYKTAVRAGLRELAFDTLWAYNTWASDHLAGYTDRLIPVTLVDLADVDWAIAEIRRMRERGSRVVQVRGEPAGGTSLAHPDFEPFWATAEDLGMLIMFHVGGGRTSPNPGWINDGDGVLDFIAAYAGLSEPQMPEWALASLIKKGVLERHPKLGVVVAELGTYWVPGFAEWLDTSVDRSLGTHLVDRRPTLPLKPSEYLQRQVRVSVVRAMDRLRPSIDHAPPGVIVFASDFPHPEGSEDALAVFDERMGDLDEHTRTQFFGGSVAELLDMPFADKVNVTRDAPEDPYR